MSSSSAFSSKDLAELKELVRLRYSTDISDQELQALASMLVELFKVVGRPLKG